MVATDGRAPYVSELLRRSRYEVVPLDGVEEQVLAHVPRDLTVTVTASPTKGLEPTLALSGSLARDGYAVVPHLSARLVAGPGEAAELADRLQRDGIRDVFVVAGDAEEARGSFHGALDLLEAFDELGRPFPQVGIAGYPESHPFVDDETIAAAMLEKARHATYLVSQVCYDPDLIVAWIDAVWARGTRLPVYVGVPGVVSRTKLLRVSTRIGIGDSLRFLRKNGSFASRFLRGGFSPDALVDGLGPLLEDERVAGFHVFTFNDVEDTETWRQARLQRLASPETAATAGS
ncbi:MAG TPA: methylenetetrahydrofolate reductase [Gaiella sp.]|nr:methylenetetrahydrofolate reductase [Gaiella sp.]